MRYVDPDGADFEEFVSSFGFESAENIVNILEAIFDLATSPHDTAHNMANGIEQGIRSVMNDPSIASDAVVAIWDKTTGSDSDRGELAADAATGVLVLAGAKNLTKGGGRLYPTESFESSTLSKVQGQMERAGKFHSNKAIRYYKYNGNKYIVDGHHRYQAAQNLGYDYYIKEVGESYLKERWGTTVDDFINKINSYYGK